MLVTAPSPELRALLLDVTLRHAVRVLDLADEQQFGSMSADDRFEVEGVEWHITATFRRDEHLVRVSGHAHAPQEGEDGAVVIANLGQFLQVFGVQQAGNREGGFDFTVPPEWVRRAAGEFGAT